MANVSLDGFLNEEKKGLVNFDWLDINPEDYNKLPFNDLPYYMAIPKLEEAWSHTDDSKNFNLVPNMETNFNSPAPKNTDDSDIKIVIDYVKKQMMSGKTGKDLVELVSQKATPNLIKQASESLQKLSNEQGLLGNVYVDPTIFGRCVDGAEFTGKMAKTAKYVLAMSKCSNCMHNRNQRCEVYKKKITAEVIYDSDTLDFYSKHFSNISGKNVTISSRKELQDKFTYKPAKAENIAENKPKNEEIEEKTLEEKKKEYNKQVKDLEHSLSNLSEFKVGQDITQLLIKGYDSSTIAKHIKSKYSSQEFEKSKEVINGILAKQGSLGRIFVEADMLPLNDTMDERSIVDQIKNIPSVKFIIIRPESLDHNKLRNVCPKMNKTIVPSINMIPRMSWENEFKTYSNDVISKISSIFEENPVKGLRLAYIQKNMAKKGNTSDEGYNLKASLDNTNYRPEQKVAVSLTPNKIKAALEKGYTLSSIIMTGRKLGSTDTEISSSIHKAFENIKEIYKYQANVKAITVPNNIKIKMSQKDVNADLGRPSENLPDFAFNSFNAPVDTFVKDFEIKSSELNMFDVKKTSTGDLGVTGLDEYTIE